MFVMVAAITVPYDKSHGYKLGRAPGNLSTQTPVDLRSACLSSLKLPESVRTVRSCKIATVDACSRWAVGKNVTRCALSVKLARTFIGASCPMTSIGRYVVKSLRFDRLLASTALVLVLALSSHAGVAQQTRKPDHCVRACAGHDAPCRR